jgi:hypothetical protein
MPRIKGFTAPSKSPPARILAANLFRPHLSTTAISMQIITMATSGTRQQRHRCTPNCGKLFIDTLPTIL